MEMREEIRKSIIDNGDRFEPSADPARTDAFGSPVTKKQLAESWVRVKEVFAGALRQVPGEREDYLDHICSDDRYLRDEVESLLNSFESADTFLESPPIVDGESIRSFGECFAPGQKVGQYEIIRKLGSGGMGEVYLAVDAKLHRPVAIKVLYRDLSGTDESKKHLLREARAAATLDHPNICSIFEISEIEGRSFIVMQYVEGETLSEILENGPLELSDAVEIGMQIADALEEAHHHKIIHRDIKPGNIIVNEKGLVKVLDFGLAKSLETGSLTDSVRHPDTHGIIMGTIPYMSPEQLRGKSLDARTDIFSLGAVLYEMVTGRRVFRKDNHAESVSAILNDQPDLGPVPSAVRFLIQKALMKDKRRRYQSAVELQDDLRRLRDSIKSGSLGRKSIWSWFSARPSDTSSYRSFFSRGTAPNTPVHKRLYAWEGSGSQQHAVKDSTAASPGIRTVDFRKFILYSWTPLTLLIVGSLTWYLWPVQQPSEPLRTVKLVNWNTGASSIYKDYSLSHDGKMIAYSSNQGGNPESIYIKQTGDGKDVPVVEDQWRNYSPVWSPDDRRIAFTSFRDGKFGIYTVPSFGGVATFVKSVGGNLVSLRQWSKDGTSILYEYQGNLFRVDVSTGESSQMTDVPPSTSVVRNFRLSPDETRIAYSDTVNGQSDIWLIENGQRRQLTNTKDEETRLAWHPDGKRILFTASRDGHYQIDVAFVDGKPTEQVTRGDGEYELIDVSPDGAKIFYRSWEDRSDVWGVKIENGEEIDVASGPESEFWPAVSPDGQYIAYQTNSNPAPYRVLQRSSITVKSNKDGSKRLSVVGTNPQWLPDGRTLSFLRWSDETQKDELWVVDTNTSEEKIVTNDPIPFPASAPFPFSRVQVRDFSWSPDGTTVVYSVQKSGVKDLRMRIPDGQIIELTDNQDPARSFLSPVWSPSGKRLVYVSQQKPSSKDQKPEWNVWLYENGGAKSIFTTSASLRLLGWISEDQLLFEKCDGPMSSRLSNISLLKLSVAGESRSLSDVRDVYALSMVLSPDGKKVAYSARQDDKDNIWIIDITSGFQKKVTANANSKLFFGSPSWTPDNKIIYFDKQEEINMISMIDNFR